MNIETQNIANKDSASSVIEGDPYSRKTILFRSRYDSKLKARTVDSTKSVDREAPFKTKFEPENPFADANGYVLYPNIKSNIAMANFREAQKKLSVEFICYFKDSGANEQINWSYRGSDTVDAVAHHVEVLESLGSNRGISGSMIRRDSSVFPGILGYVSDAVNKVEKLAQRSLDDEAWLYELVTTLTKTEN